MSARNGWMGPRATKARRIVAIRMAKTWAKGEDVLCWRCETPIEPTEEWHVGHIIDIAARPDLMWVPSNWAAEHARKCNLADSARKTNAKRSLRAKRLWQWT